MRIEEFLEEAVQRFPEKPALIVDDRRVTYAQLDEWASQCANLLLESGLQRGDRVVVYLDNSIESVIAIFGTARANGVFSMVNAAVRPTKLQFIIRNLKPRFIVTQSRLLRSCEEACSAADFVERIFITDAKEAPASPTQRLFWPALENSAKDRPRPPALDIDLAYVSYTSGSTGVPKGVMMTHQSSQVGSAAMIKYLGLNADDIILSVVPLSFDYGLYQVIMSVTLAATLVLELSFAFPNKIMRKAASVAATVLPIVPTMAAIIVGLKNLVPGSIPSMRCITTTSAPFPAAHSARLQELFPGARIFSNYGLTETIRSTYLPPEQLAIRPTSVGKAMPHTEATIVDANGNRVEANTVGELVLRGANLLKGYWENPEATAKALRPGPYPWEQVFFTGDLFTADDEGFLYFVGRVDDMIKSRGEKVAPREVENVLYQLPGIREAAVIGVPDAIQGMAIRAVLALEVDCHLCLRDVQNHCAKYLEDYMIPSSVEFLPELPKTESGKIQRRLLQDQAAASASVSGRQLV